MNKKILSLIVVSLIIGASFSCKKLIASLFSGLEFNVPDMSITIPAVPIITPSEVNFGSITQNINLDSVVKANTANQFGADVVKNVTIKTVTVTISNADDLNNLSNFESARIVLTSNTNSSAINIASVTFPTSATNSYVYTPTDNTELVTYLKGSSLTYTIYGKNRKITTKPLTFVVSVRLKVN